ncbi:MarR family transcriptional regulator [Actinomycetes bacterium KLBMP 9797]
MEPVTADQYCSTFLVRHAWLSMRSVVAEALTAHGLSVAQFASLLLLAEEPGMSVAELARKVSTARQSANEMLGGLERAGLIERRPHPQDRRSQQIFLTPAGEERLAAAGPEVKAVEDRLSAGFTPDNLAVVEAWLNHMAAASTRAAEDLPTL